ncbi:GNAT family N-acetyltransferase [Arsenicicoccus dermatophilus]|uniref:GNAT family N-acetyltransferase n=1 Tax=Arsenicicoccus dermatophilus TaxID=1076331 RepID=UPI003916E8B8
MTSDLLGVNPQTATTGDGPPPRVALRPLEAATTTALAALYLASYPPGIAAADMDEAVAEIEATFRGEYGVLRSDAGATAWSADHPVGAIMVVERSIWDPGLDGPFVIELFVAPEARGLGAGRALMAHAIQACARSGDAALSLRVGEGTSPAAMAIYRSLGFAPPPAG